ncbi:zinc finger C3H1 domain-containing protein isoform X1 [Oncorhynchus kisutch]|uniref:Zinc finger C3H1-type containing n=1 Tax=Oncorhynchus kisutch TaxID=8019 RepID=A0A8C7FWI2_ONCKI|nr:zinc finger C3H1 domain-containing protein isoform X1 [Oncorhynchus kisutch]
MDSKSSNRTDEGELEDGEICDDDTDEKVLIQQDTMRPSSTNNNSSRNSRKSKPSARSLPPLMGSQPTDFRLLMPYNRGPHSHSPFPPNHRPQSGPDRPPPLGPHCDQSPRSSFWERSHTALGRFRHRWKPEDDGRGDWGRGGWGDGCGGGRETGWVPPGRYGPGENHSNKKESPSRNKQKVLMGRNQVRNKQMMHHNAAKTENGVNESFEDLLTKYKQIQLELECIRKEENMVLKAEEDLSALNEPELSASNPQTEPLPDTNSIPNDSAAEEKKVFQAFNLKPLRQKLLTPAEIDALKTKTEKKDPEKEDGDTESERGPVEPVATPIAIPKGEEEKDGLKKEANKAGEKDTTACVCCRSKSEGPEEEGETKYSKVGCVCCSESSEDSTPSPVKPKVKGSNEDEELSELQLRLLALQSASRKWHQKEQQVMNASKEKITNAKPSQEKITNAKPSQEKITNSKPSQEKITNAKPSQEKITNSKPSQEKTSSSTSSASNPAERGRVTTRSASSAASEKAKALANKPQEKAKAGAKPPVEKSKAPVKGYPGRKMVSPGSVAKQAFRKQQLRTWKLQQQRDQDELRRQEEEERRRREEEIRKIRDLSNQDEQYNRFMKLVGGSKPPLARNPSKSRDSDHTRKSSGKQGLDTSGNLYQYDNYDEVAMDTDSETNSPASSPVHDPFEVQGCFTHMHMPFPMDSPQYRIDLGQPRYLSVIPSAPPPPLPPMPPPPDELEPPPKPPFADEEEEEEMLLRETCLMSMANKKEITLDSGPPSPSPLVSLVQPVPMSNRSVVSLNTAPQPRNKKFSRGHHHPRLPLVLPRHKAVVVQLNGSDDSDSDIETCGSSTRTQFVFGGLEFMIKEARRSAEAAKAKPTSGSEENEPVRTPEALSDAKKAEYRLLKGEIASREKQKVLMDHSPRAVSSPAGSDPDVDFAAKAAAKLQLTEAETNLTKHRNLLLKDDGILRQLLQQEQKKKEALKAAEAKVAKLKEQLLASEKIVSANKTLLNRLQEQVHRVQLRVSVKKNHSLKLQKEMVQAQAAAGREPGVQKRRTDISHPSPAKRLRVEVSVATRGTERHFADLLAQKQRLQLLESEYALKIQKLKEAQALHNRGAVPEPPPPQATSTPIPRARQPSAPPTSPFPLPQPSLHDLTQDKLALVSSEDITETEDGDMEPATAAVPSASTQSVRRRSFRETGAFTKPKLEPGGTGLVKDCPAKSAKVKAPGPGELFLGLEVEALQTMDKQQANLGELLLGELRALGGTVEKPPAGKVIEVDVDIMAAQSSRAELKPVPFGQYRSPLLVFKSYRFSPYFRTKEKLSLSSVSYSNVVVPKKCFCRFDLTGTCNDDDCKWQHMRNCTFGGNQLFHDILSYNLALIGCSESSTTDDISVATEKYLKKLFGTNKDRMGMDQKAVLLLSKVNESKRHVPPFTTCKDLRRWRPQPARQASPSAGDDSGDECADANPGPVKYDGFSKRSLSAAMDVCVTPDDKRYFISETDDISNLETSVLESPRDAQLWIKLAFKYLSQKETSVAECLDAALNTLSRALEDNRDNPEIWCHYLSLFSRRGKRDEVQEMCEMAVEHAPDYQVWWSYLTMESSFEGKDYVCGRLLQYLLDCSWTSGFSERLSFQLLESLLYRVQLSVFTGRLQNALAILQNALKSVTEQCIADHLTASDRCLVWLSFIHLTEFDRLPASLYDPANSNPSRVVSTESFALPWRKPLDVRTEPDTLIAVFEDAVRQCTDQTLPPSERTLVCLPLYTNLIACYSLLGKYDAGLELCESLLALCPQSCVLLDALSGLYVGKGDCEQGVCVWLRALSQCPHNAEVFYHTCKFFMAQEKSSCITPLFREFVLSFCDGERSEQKPVDVLRSILGIPTEDILRGPVIKKQLQEQLSHQKPYLNLVHCLWQWVHGSVGEAMDAFERALGAVMQLNVLQKLWMDYLLFTSSKLAGSPSNGRELRMLSDLVQRCLVTVPSRLEVPFSSAQYWSCFRFHNKVMFHYLCCLPQSQHPHILERLKYTMPTNAELALRLLYQEWQDGNIEHLKFQARMLSSSIPNYLANWKIAIAVERELKERSEVRLLYQQALQKLPLCATLWKDRLLFEAAEGGKTDKLRKLVDKCQEVGVSLSEPLNLVWSKMEREDH